MPRKPKRPSPTEAELDAAAADLARLVDDPSLISGVHNYCDRWCERCPLTTRCLVFKVERARRSSAKRADAANESFWADVAKSVALAMRLVQREARKHGIDLDTADANSERALNAARQSTARQDGRLHRASRDYAKTAGELLERLSPELDDVGTALATEARLGAGTPERTAMEIRDALEVVQWYLFFIDVKLHRATSSRADEGSDVRMPASGDADGSAKIALVAIDRSIGAWAQLREHCTDHADTILDVLVQLDRLRRGVEHEFPQARAFKRPGFDA